METALWAGPVFGTEPLADAGLEDDEPEILGESAGLLGNCGSSDTALLSHKTHTIFYHVNIM